jgi:hypothetical protein
MPLSRLRSRIHLESDSLLGRADKPVCRYLVGARLRRAKVW